MPMDKILDAEKEIIKAIAGTDDDPPVLMLNQNRYKKGEYPDGDVYNNLRSVNKKMIDSVGCKIIWTLPVKGQVLELNTINLIVLFIKFFLDIIHIKVWLFL